MEECPSANVVAPTQFAAKWLEARYKKMIVQILFDLIGVNAPQEVIFESSELLSNFTETLKNDLEIIASEKKRFTEMGLDDEQVEGDEYSHHH